MLNKWDEYLTAIPIAACLMQAVNLLDSVEFLAY